MRDAESGLEEVKSCVGRSFCPCIKVVSTLYEGSHWEELTSSTLPFPLSFTDKAYDVSKLVAGSLTSRKAWCGRFALRSSLAVSKIFNVSEGPSRTGFGKGLFGASLRCEISIRLVWRIDWAKHTSLWWRPLLLQIFCLEPRPWHHQNPKKKLHRRMTQPIKSG